MDLVPFKTCSLDCPYCQLGKTTHKTLQRQAYGSPEDIIFELRDALQQYQKIDYITIGGSGEPTLSTRVGRLISRVKEITSIPVAVLTNGTLLHSEQVRDELVAADVVIPSLDAVSEDVFARINRPHPQITVSRMIAGLKRFREVFPGKLWLEIMLVRGINDAPEEMGKMKSVIASIAFDKVQLNTPVRPSPDRILTPLTEQELTDLKGFFGEPCEVIAEFSGKQYESEKAMQERMITMLSRHPLNLADLSASLGVPQAQLTELICFLEDQGRIESREYGDECYYYLKR
jgi:wyosine [tRNA(Phe)-imidazoG37] synthetase (radical SAM superfamily)